MIKAYFLSDIHLRSMKESNGEKLLLFLYALAESFSGHGVAGNSGSNDSKIKVENDRSLGSQSRPMTYLFLVGDIFDLWIHKHKYFVAKFFKIVNAISELVEKGVQVHYFEGNHDFHLKQFWQQEVGVRVHDGPAFFNLGSYRIRVEHGDFMNPHDKSYLLLRSFFRSKIMTFIFKTAPGSFIHWVGERLSQISRHYSSGSKKDESRKTKEEKIKTFMKDYARKVIQEDFFDYLITGHTHVRYIDAFKKDDRQVYSINLGSWFEEQKILVLDDEGHRFQSVSS